MLDILNLKNASKNTIEEINENLNFIFQYGNHNQIVEIFNLLNVLFNKIKKEKDILKNIKKNIDIQFIKNNIGIFLNCILSEGNNEQINEALDWLFIIKDEIDLKSNLIKFSEVKKMYENRK